MLKLSLAFVLITVLLACGAVPAGAALPGTADEFKNLVTAQSGDPVGATKLFFAAVFVTTHKDEALGHKMLDEIMCTDKWEDTHPVLAAALKESKWVFDSYDTASDPENFELDASDPDMLSVSLFDLGELAKVRLATSASDTARPIYLKKIDGGWRVASESPLCTGLKAADGNPGEDIAGTNSPAGVVHLWLEAMYLYVLGDKEEGERIWRACLASNPPETSIALCKRQVAERPYIVFSYAVGTSPEESYLNFDPFSFTVEITRTEDVAGNRKAFVRSSGADNPRPFMSKITKRGQLRMDEYSSLYVGVKTPPKPEW